MDWQSYYRDHIMTAVEAIRRIHSGDRVVTAHACGEPTALIDAMVDGRDAYSDVEIVHMVPMGKAEYCAEGMERHFRHNSLFAGGSTRKAISDGRADFTPVLFSEIPRLFDGVLPVDVALIQVSPPDAHGYCSLGVSVDYTRHAAECARTVIAQVNPQMPRVMGEGFLHVSEVDCFVEADEQLIELPKARIGEVEAQIGRNCASLVRDGDTLQLGIGAIPDAVLESLGDKNDLGIHSEMFSDGVVDLVEAGVITNKRKTLHPGCCVAAFLMGSRKLYDFVDDNPMVHMAPVDYVNDPCVIAQNDNLVSINSCIQVDLLGQVVSSSVGLRQISGVGGQLDFVRGAAMSRGGRSIMAVGSTARHGEISKMVPFIEQGAAVTTGRCDVDYVVTEYGVAHLWGKTLRERARELIAVAHPKFRDELDAEYQKRFSALQLAV